MALFFSAWTVWIKIAIAKTTTMMIKKGFLNFSLIF